MASSNEQPAMPATIVERAQAWVAADADDDTPQESSHDIVRDLAKLPVDGEADALRKQLDEAKGELDSARESLGTLRPCLKEITSQLHAAETAIEVGLLEYRGKHDEARELVKRKPMSEEGTRLADKVNKMRCTIELQAKHLNHAEAERDEAKAEVDRLASELDPPVCRLQLPDGSVPGNAREAAEMWHAACQEMWRQRDEARRELDAAVEHMRLVKDNESCEMRRLREERDEAKAAANARAVAELKALRDHMERRQKLLAKGFPADRVARDAADYWLRLATEGAVGCIDERIAALETEPQPITTVLTPEDMGAELQRELPQPSTDLDQARRDYTSRLPPEDEERCHNCVHSTLSDGGGAHCRRLDIVVECSRTSRCPVHEPEQPGQQANLKHSVEQLLRMIAMVPEQQLPWMGIDPYGRIGDALEAIGQPREPDSWRALSKWAHGYDCGEYVEPEQPEDDGGGEDVLSKALRKIPTHGLTEHETAKAIAELIRRVRKLEGRR